MTMNIEHYQEANAAHPAGEQAGRLHDLQDRVELVAVLRREGIVAAPVDHRAPPLTLHVAAPVGEGPRVGAGDDLAKHKKKIGVILPS